VKLPTLLMGPVLLFLTGGFVISFSPVGLVSNALASSTMYAAIDLLALRAFLKVRPTRRAVVAVLVAEVVLFAAAIAWMVTGDREFWLKVRWVV
jgi:hypothetical protein